MFAKAKCMSAVTCDVLDRLEEAALRKSRVRVTLKDGRSITDDVREVVTEGGRNFGVFAHAGRIDVEEMTNCERAES